MAKDQTATVTLDAFEQPFVGKVTRMHGDAETTSTGSVAFEVEVAIETGDHPRAQRMSGSVELATESIPDALVVPVAAVQTRGTTRTVFVVGDDSIVHAREVTVGVTTDASRQILSGLSAGDRVVSPVRRRLTDGSRCVK